MKKSLLVIALASATTFASAQDMNSKRGTPILPEPGDYSIGIDAVPFLEYFGNLMNGSNSAPSFDFKTSPFVISGLYVKDANTAYRGKLRLGFGSNTVNYATENDATTADPNDQSFDEVKSGGKSIFIGGGLQKTRGKHRLHGIYGGEALIGLQSSKTEHSFANAFSATNPAPSTGIPGQPSNGDPRTTEVKSGGEFSFTLRAFVGVEYFFAPKMSVSGEFGWGLGLVSQAEGEQTTESFDGTTVKSVTTKTGKSSSFGIDTDNSGGSINLNFYL